MTTKHYNDYTHVGTNVRARQSASTKPRNRTHIYFGVNREWESKTIDSAHRCRRSTLMVELNATEPPTKRPLLCPELTHVVFPTTFCSLCIWWWSPRRILCVSVSVVHIQTLGHILRIWPKVAYSLDIPTMSDGVYHLGRTIENPPMFQTTLYISGKYILNNDLTAHTHTHTFYDI